MRITLVMFLAWFTNALTYVGLYMVSMTMSGDRYLNLFLSSIAETPAALLLFPVVLSASEENDVIRYNNASEENVMIRYNNASEENNMIRCGRRKVLIVLHLLAGLSLIGAAIIHVTTDSYAGYIALTSVIMLGKFSIAATYNLIFMYTPELYPTNIRSLGIGVVSIASRIGGLLSPFAATLSREVPWLPAAVFGGFCLLVALSCPLLPETRGKDLPQTLADLENLYRTNSSTKQKKQKQTEMEILN
ncbi:solute carrier family 22 member 15-like [Liolophura sinensis]|uniref:solute carrier family 22 member 15-like n=1 Tax=Liolophura sinensis TaxID=3198878 RepID=UPI003158FF3E